MLSPAASGGVCWLLWLVVVLANVVVCCVAVVSGAIAGAAVFARSFLAGGLCRGCRLGS